MCHKRSTFRQILHGALRTMSVAALIGCSGSVERTQEVNPSSGLQFMLTSQWTSTASQGILKTQYEEEVVSCMRDQGWTYFNEGSRTEDVIDVGSPDFPSKWGYGVTATYLGVIEPILRTAQEVDRNAEYAASLSDDARSRYQLSLVGPPSTDTGSNVGVVRTGGCEGAAYDQVYGKQPSSDPRFLERYSGLLAEMKSDPAFKSSEKVWAECMRRTYTESIATVDDPAHILERMLYSKMGLQIIAGGNDADGSFASWTDGSGTSFVATGEPTSIPAESVSELRAFEISLWNTDADCASSTGLAEVRTAAEANIASVLLAEFPYLNVP